MKETILFTGCINGIHLGNLEFPPPYVFGKKMEEFTSDEWISFIAMLHTKCKKLEKDIEKLSKL